MTRAQERLIVSGVAPRREVARRDRAGGAADRLDRARAVPAIDAGRPGASRSASVAWTTPARRASCASARRSSTPAPSARRCAGRRARAGAPRTAAAQPAGARRTRGALGSPPRGPPPTLSYSALAPGRALRLPLLPRARARPAARARAAAAAGRRGAAPAGGSTLMMRGSLVHGLLEELDLATGGPCGGRRRRRRAPGPGARGRRTARPGARRPRRPTTSTRSSRSSRAAAARAPGRGATRVQREDGVRVPARRRRRPLSTASSTSSPRRPTAARSSSTTSPTAWSREPTPRRYVERDYAVQRLLYALAALRAGAPRVEVVHALLERPAEPVTATYTAADVPTLERDLLDLAAGPLGGDYRVSRDAAPRAVRDCPGRRAHVLVAGGDDPARAARRFVAEAMK